MKTLALQKRLAASVLDVGKNKVWFNPEKISDIEKAITKEDIAALVKEKIIKKKPMTGIKRRAGIKRQLRKRKGRGKGPGKRKKIVKRKKQKYVKKIRKLRAYISWLRKTNSIGSQESAKLKKLAKAGTFKTKADITQVIKEKKKK